MYLKETKENNKAKFPKKIGKAPKGVCRTCSIEISKENQLYYTHGGKKTECKPCSNKKTLEYNRNRLETIKKILYGSKCQITK